MNMWPVREACFCPTPGMTVYDPLFWISKSNMKIMVKPMVIKRPTPCDLMFRDPRFLCDFAAHLENCPEGPNCIGPGGTSFTAHLGCVELLVLEDFGKSIF